MSSPHEGLPWAGYIGDRDRRTVDLLGRTNGATVTVGPEVALLVVDVVVGFTGTTRMPMEAAVEEFPTSCGEVAWDVLPRISNLVEEFRRHGRLVVWTRNPPGLAEHAGPTTTLPTQDREALRSAASFPACLQPQEGEFVLEKPRASAFFMTALPLVLSRRAVRRVVVVGATTSGCVRATAVDASSHGLAPIVVQGACFDRFELSHAAALFDIQMKYGDVVPAANLDFSSSTEERCV